MPNLLIIPSIDIRDGKTVRIVQGIPELNCPEYCNDPVEMAMIWRAENAKIIHVVDFNSATEHSHINFNVIKKICEAVIIPVEFGAGLRNIEDVREAFNLGIFRVVLGTMAYENPNMFKKLIEEFTPNKIVAAIDVIDEEVVVYGRKFKTGLKPEAFAKKLKEYGIKRFIVTDVKTNGMLSGPNIDLSKRIADVTECKVTHSGGIGGYEDLRKLQVEAKDYVDSVIIGRALYENKFPCQKIWRVAEHGIFN